MTTDDLTYGETFFLNVYRSFRFLLEGNGYIGQEFSIGGREEQWVSFYSPIKKLKITILERGSGHLDFYLETKAFVGWRKRTLNDFINCEIKVQSISRLVTLIRDNPSLMEELMSDS